MEEKEINLPNQYSLIITEGDKTGSMKYLVEQPSGKIGFKDNDKKDGCTIYAVLHKWNSIRYIGKTENTVKERLDSSLKSKTYDWAVEGNCWKLLVWDLSDFVRSKVAIESIEADFALALRVYHGGWSTHQKQVTFHGRRSWQPDDILKKPREKRAMIRDVVRVLTQQFHDICFEKAETDDTKKLLEQSFNKTCQVMNLMPV